MKTFITNVAHGIVSLLLITIPFILQQNPHWLSFSIGTALVAIQHYLVSKQAVAGAVRAGKVN